MRQEQSDQLFPFVILPKNEKTQSSGKAVRDSAFLKKFCYKSKEKDFYKSPSNTKLQCLS